LLRPAASSFLTSCNTFPQDLNHNTSKHDSFLYLLRPATRSFLTTIAPSSSAHFLYLLRPAASSLFNQKQIFDAIIISGPVAE
jgi:hypothetical protein